jgi:hypothetical protein
VSFERQLPPVTAPCFLLFLDAVEEDLAGDASTDREDLLANEEYSKIL